jgi:hypothetical protein
MERYANGDEAVFEQLYALLAPRLYRFCKRITYRCVASRCSGRGTIQERSIGSGGGVGRRLRFSSFAHPAIRYIWRLATCCRSSV